MEDSEGARAVFSSRVWDDPHGMAALDGGICEGWQGRWLRLCNTGSGGEWGRTSGSPLPYGVKGKGHYTSQPLVRAVAEYLEIQRNCPTLCFSYWCSWWHVQGALLDQ